MTTVHWQATHAQLQADHTALLSTNLKVDPSAGSRSQTQAEALQAQLFSATQQLFEVKGVLDQQRSLLDDEKKLRAAELAASQQRLEGLRTQLEAELEQKENALEKAHRKYNELLATKNAELKERDRLLEDRAKELLKEREQADHRVMLKDQEIRARADDVQRLTEERDEQTRMVAAAQAKVAELQRHVKAEAEERLLEREGWTRREAELTKVIATKAREYAELDEQSMKAYTELQAEYDALERRLETLIEEKMADTQRWKDEKAALVQQSAEDARKAEVSAIDSSRPTTSAASLTRAPPSSCS